MANEGIIRGFTYDGTFTLQVISPKRIKIINTNRGIRLIFKVKIN